MNCLLVPTLGLDISLITRLAKSVDFPIEKKLIVNNGVPGSLSEWNSQNRDWRVVSWPMGNTGVAGAWNLAPHFFQDEDAWLIVNDDHQFQPGSLKIICEQADEHGHDHSFIFVNGYQAFDIFVWTRRGLKKLGLFDENFWPAYYEDNDMQARLRQKPKEAFHINPPVPIFHGKPRPCDSGYLMMLKECGQLNEAYLASKWRTVPRDMKHWRLDREGRRDRLAIWERWWNYPDRKFYV